MELRNYIVAVAIALAALGYSPGPLAAEPVGGRAEGEWTITFATALRQLPGETSPKLAQLRVGMRVQVLGRKDRWLRAKHRGKLGWIPRTTAEPPAPDRAPRRVRPIERWRGGAIQVAGAVKQVDDTARSHADDAPTTARTRAPASAPVVEADHAANYLVPRRRARMRAGLGASSFGVEFRSDGQTELAAYRISATAVAAGASGELSIPLGPISLGVDAAYVVAVGAPGIRYRDGAESLEPVGFSLQDVDAGLVVGAPLPVGRGIRVSARAGWHFTWLHVDEVDNPGLLARERLTGVTLGGRLETSPGRNLLARAGADVLVGGDRDQTPGLEDGAQASESAAWFSLALGYLIARRSAIEGGYRLGWASTRWTGASPRQPDVMSARRSDRSHGFLISVNTSFE